MAKKIATSTNYYSEYSMIGISCHLKNYRLSYFINEALRIEFKRQADLIQVDEDRTYSLYFFPCEETHNNYFLISNHHSAGKLIPALKQFDYFLLIQHAIRSEKKKQIIRRLKNIPNFLAAFEICMKDIKGIDTVLVELELQLMSKPPSVNN